MSHPRVITWLPVDPVLIAPPQVLAEAGKLSLNSSVPGQPQGAFIYDGVIRQISINAGAHDLAANFIVTGIGSPFDAKKNPTETLRLITEPIAGPVAGDSSVSANIYSQIISITVDDAVDDVSVGSGGNGITNYVFLDYNRTIFQTSVQLQFNPQSTATVTVYQSLTKPQVIDINAGNLINIQPIPYFPVSVELTDATDNALGVLISPVSLTWAAINNATNDLITFTVLQQGTCS